MFKIYSSSWLKIAGFDYSSVQINVPEGIAKSIRAFGKKYIKDNQLYIEDGHFGREEDTHITVKYGLITTNKKEVEEVINGFGAFDVVLGKVTQFSDVDDYDVLKIDVKSDKLKELHKKLSKLKNEDTHPMYKPHCTLAYVLKGEGLDIVGNDEFEGISFNVNNVIFSTKTEKQIQIKL